VFGPDLAAPFTGLFAQRLGPPLTAGCETEKAFHSPVHGASRCVCDPVWSERCKSSSGTHSPACNSKVLRCRETS
jgi:hypothetical protein